MKLDNPRNLNSRAVVLPDGNTYQIIKGEMYQVIHQNSLGEIGFLKKAFKKLKKFAANKIFTKFGGKFGISPWAVGAGVAAGGYLMSRKKKKKKRRAAPPPPAFAAAQESQAPISAAPSPIERVDNSMPMMEQKAPINWLLIGGIGLAGYVLLSNKK